MEQGAWDRAMRRLIKVLSPALGLIVRFRLAWILRRKLLSLSPGNWLRRHNVLGAPQGASADAVVGVTVVLDARGASLEAVGRTIGSLLAAHRAALTVHLVLADTAAASASAQRLDPRGACRLRIWKASELGALLSLAAGAGDYCLCVALNGDADIFFNTFALLHLVSAIELSPDVCFVYCDEIVQRGHRVEVFCKPAWDRVLFDSLDYIGPAILLRSTLLLTLALPPRPDCGLVEQVVAGVLNAGNGSVSHLPLPLVRVAIRADQSFPRRRCISQQQRRGQTAPRPVVSVIIPTRDRADLLATCLRTLRQTVADASCLEIVLVDNGSTCPASVSLLQAEAASGSIVVRDAGDFNFSRLINLGAKAATGAFLLLLNNDIEFRSSGWLDEMLRHAVHKHAGCVGATLLYPNGIVQHAGVVLGMHSILLDEPVAGHAHHGWPGAGSGYFRLLEHARSVSAVTAALLLVSRAVFHAVGGFDEELAVALNDVDFCLKVQQLGLTNIVVPVTGVLHLESASRALDYTRAKVERLRAENALLRGRWGVALCDDAFYNPNLDLVLSYGLTATPRQREARVRGVV